MVDAAVQQRFIACAFALHQVRLHLDLLMRLRVDLRLERLVSRQSDLDLMLPGRYQHPSSAALELTHMPHEHSIKKNGRS